MKLVVVKHPLIEHKLSIVRNKDTNSKMIRELVSEIGSLITYELTKDLELKEFDVTTPITKTKGYALKKEVVVVSVLRAGLGMADGVLNLIPSAKIGHIGLYRDEETLTPHSYYEKLPKNLENAVVIVVDPMLATGGSAVAAISKVKSSGAKDIRYMGLIGAPEGIKKLQDNHPDVSIYLAKVDEGLNESGYIVPGFGDCGDRLFNTK